MHSFQRFLDGLGALHDAVVEELVWRPGHNSLLVNIADIYVDLVDSSVYPGRTAGALHFKGISSLSIEIDFGEKRLHVYELSTNEINGQQEVVVRFWPAGLVSLTCQTIDYPAVDESILGSQEEP